MRRHLGNAQRRELCSGSTSEEITEHNIGENDTIPVTTEWLKSQGIEPPAEGMRWVYATVEQQSSGK